MAFRFKEMPCEASLFFLGWIWIGASLFGMTAVNMAFPEAGLYQSVYHTAAGIIYLFPAVCIGLKISRNRKIAGLPLFICSVIIGIWAISLHLKMNAGQNIVYFSGKGAETIMMTVLSVAVPLSFCAFARSAGCRETRSMTILKIFAVSIYFIMTAAEITGISDSVSAAWLFIYSFFAGPALGVLYMQMMRMHVKE